MRNLLVVIGILFGMALSHGQMPTYYQGIDFSQSVSTVENELKTLITNTHNPLTYSQTYQWVVAIDEDENNSSNVVLIYNGQSEPKSNTIGNGNTLYPEVWNREHVYPQTFLNTTASADLHHLRACDGTINNNRGNSPFATGSGTYGSVSGGWYPGDEWKGDVARMIMYVHLRYDEPWTDVGSMSLFLQWNVEDPVSSFEMQRNNYIQNAQGNRNPFIDQPYLATYLWGGSPAEDTWGWPNEVEETSLEEITLYPNPVSTTGNVTFSNISTTLAEIVIYNLSGKSVQSYRNPTTIGQEVKVPTELPSGVYFVKFIVDDQQLTKKLIVN